MAADPAHIADLWREYKASPTVELRNRIVEWYAELVVRCSRHHGPWGQEDRRGTALVALMKLVEEYDHSVPFLAFVATRLHGRMLDVHRAFDKRPLPRAGLVLFNTYEDGGRERYVVDTIPVRSTDPLRILSDRELFEMRIRGLCPAEQVIARMVFEDDRTVAESIRLLGMDQKSGTKLWAAVRKKLRTMPWVPRPRPATRSMPRLPADITPAERVERKRAQRRAWKRSNRARASESAWRNLFEKRKKNQAAA